MPDTQQPWNDPSLRQPVPAAPAPETSPLVVALMKLLGLGEQPAAAPVPAATPYPVNVGEDMLSQAGDDALRQAALLRERNAIIKQHVGGGE